MKYYCFVYPGSDTIRSSQYAPFESDELAIQEAVLILETSIEDECLDVYGDGITVIRCTASGERVYTEAIADILINECTDCGGSYAEVFAA